MEPVHRNPRWRLFGWVLEWLGSLVLTCHSETELFNILTTVAHLKSEHVQYSSPHCIRLNKIAGNYISSLELSVWTRLKVALRIDYSK